MHETTVKPTFTCQKLVSHHVDLPVFDAVEHALQQFSPQLKNLSLWLETVQDVVAALRDLSGELQIQRATKSPVRAPEWSRMAFSIGIHIAAPKSLALVRLLHALDINTSNLPPEPWFPNLRRHTYNVNDPPPESLVSYFDIINVQLAWTFIGDHNFDTVFANILAFLKPGGYIQWTEFDPRGVQAFSPDPEYKPYAMVKLFPDSYEIIGMDLPRWPWTLDDVIGRNKVEIVKTVRPDVQWKMLRSWTRQQMTTWEEVREMFWKTYGSSGDEETRKKVEAFEELLVKAREEATVKGCSYFEPIVRVVGKKGAS